MKKILLTGCLFLLPLCGPAMSEEAAKPLQNDAEKLSYVIGFDLGGYLKGLEQQLDLQVLAKGMQDAYKGSPSVLPPEEAMAVQQQFAKSQQEKEIKAILELSEKNRAAATAFLEENKKRKEVQTTQSGLQYEILQAGTGKKPGAEDTVSVHYKGTLLNGTEFDSSYARNKPAVFQVNQVIPGWTEALGLMGVGSKWKLYIPPDLAYGDRSIDPVEPGSLLIFEVELLDVGIPAEDTPAAETGKEEKK